MALEVLAETSIKRDPEQVHGLHVWVRGLIGDRHPRIRDIALCLAEVATNSLRHTDSSKIWIVVLADEDLIRVEVIDDGSSGETPHLRVVDAYDETGRGLLLVESLTGGRWGTWTDEAGRTTWLEIASTSSPAEAGVA